MVELTKDQEKEVKKQVNKELKIREKQLDEKVKEAEKNLYNKLIKTTSEFGSDFKKHTSAALITAFGLVMALTWKDLILAVITHYTSIDSLDSYPFLADLFTVIIVTVIGVIGLVFVTRWAKQPDSNNKIQDPDPTS